ncbi:MAG: bifunctional [glutamine synthetase] adenylyltransferase/[glutamine synthetase]-adenylyl-L-tyrosine phosphorylase [Candidatus Ancillula sp.]|jgi:glutamate-ammonia-ligase adenylyltransferase|nr:bifunctional [glutamine synthetase] adenylyltransferase/[glutamine synthetase]-adenylyl-L-tyrosine phosphorylase [Candidatus Ancillula sp.]
MDTSKLQKRLQFYSNAVSSWCEKYGGLELILSEKVVIFDKQNFTSASNSNIDYEKEVTKLRKNYRKRLIQIVVDDIAVTDPLGNIVQIMSDLTAAAKDVLTGSFAISAKKMNILNPELAIIAMGKCGAGELNYISDVDLIFVASQNCIDSGVAQKLATSVTEVCNGLIGGEPVLWEIDTALRPEGKVGALVRTVESTANYYQKWAENWEFQALLKAHAVAGNAVIGAEYEKMRSNFVWIGATRSNFISDSQEMRARVIDNIPVKNKNLEIKLGKGGLRDIEFTIQLLQMIHGRINTKIRSPRTLDAIEELRDSGYIGRSTADEIMHAYKLLRYIEHRVQMWSMRRTHLFPTSPEEITRVALGLKMHDDEFMELYNATRAKIRQLHLSIFYHPMLEIAASLTSKELRLTTADAQERLKSLGFEDAQATQHHIDALVSGSSRKALIMRQILPSFLNYLAGGVNKGNGLLVFRKISEKVGEAPWFLRLLRDNNQVAARLAFVLTNSKYISNALVEHPMLIQLMADEVENASYRNIECTFDAVLERSNNVEDAICALLDVREREILRLALCFAFKTLDDDQIALQITKVTDLLILNVLDIVNKQYQTKLFAIAMGSYGGKELGFSSDADIVLVHNGEDDKQAVDAALTFRHLLQKISTTELNLKLDFDLRPEGKNGSIVRSFASYDEYYKRFAQNWEFQALLRARVLNMSGSELTDDALKLEQIINTHRYKKNFITDDALQEIRKMKARIETERARTANGRIDLKLGSGGLSDIEWLVQVKQLEFVYVNPALRTISTTSALDELLKIGILTADEYSKLLDAWQLSIRLRNANSLILQGDVLLDDERYLSMLNKFLSLKFNTNYELYDYYKRCARISRKIFEQHF